MTNQCNLRCVYCFVHKTPEKMETSLSQLAMRKVFETAERSGYKKISLNFSGGECTLDPKAVFSLVTLGRNLAKTYGLEAEFGMLTNATLIDNQLARKIKKERLEIGVSLDGDERVHDLTRVYPDGKGSYQQTIKGLSRLLNEGVPVTVSVTVTSKNIDSLPALTKTLLIMDVPFIFNIYKNTTGKKTGLEPTNKALTAGLLRCFKEIEKSPPRYSLLNGLVDRLFLDVPHLYPCKAGRGYLLIKQDGTLASCPTSIESGFGSIDDSNLINSIEKGFFIQPRISVDDIQGCNTCRWRYSCCSGCPILRYAAFQKYQVRSPYCATFKKVIPEILKLEAKRIVYHSKNTT